LFFNNKALNYRLMNSLYNIIIDLFFIDVLSLISLVHAYVLKNKLKKKKKKKKKKKTSIIFNLLYLM